MKGQSSIEMLTTVGIMFAFIVPALVLLLSVSGQNFEEVSKAQADVTSKRIAEEIGRVYMGGVGSKKGVLVNLPNNALSLNVTQEEVTIVVQTQAGISESSYPIIGEISNELDTNKKGLFFINMENINNEVVLND